MTKKYGRWNQAAFYPNCNRTSIRLHGYSTEKMLYRDKMEIQVRNYHNEDGMRIGSFELQILVRIAASCGLTRWQLENFLLMQGLAFSAEHLEECLDDMVKLGYLTSVGIRRQKDDALFILYDLAERGRVILENCEMPNCESAATYFLCKDTFRYTRAKIVTNQLVLHLLGSLKGFRTFYFNRVLRLKGAESPEETIVVPLYIQTDAANYIFEPVANTISGRKAFKERLEQLLTIQDKLPDQSVLVVVAETYEHMERLTSIMLAYEKRGLKMDVLYTHDSEWFYETAGAFYAMARAMGQSGLLRVKMY